MLGFKSNASEDSRNKYQWTLTVVARV